MKKLSVIIATHNRPGLLSKCLRSLINQKNNQTEIIVVDNSSKQSAKKISQLFKVRYVHDKKIGLAHARNIGWQKARGEYVAYIDDDSVANHNWVSEILSFIKKKPEIKAFGGSYSRHSKKKIPIWFSKDFGTLSNGNALRKLDIGSEWLSGTNMVFKKSLLKALNGFNESLGMVGNKIAYGEEAELLLRLKMKKIDVFYNPKMHVSHLLDARKINFWWLMKDAFTRGKNSLNVSNNKIKAGHKQLRLNFDNYFQLVVSLSILVSFALGKLFSGKK